MSIGVFSSPRGSSGGCVGVSRVCGVCRGVEEGVRVEGNSNMVVVCGGTTGARQVRHWGWVRF